MLILTPPRYARLLDCGVTVLASLKRGSIRADSIDAVLVSHLHGDHFAGIPFLLLEYTCCEPRSRPLLIVGPPETGERVHELYRAMYRDVGSDPLPFPVEFVELRPGSKARAGEAEVLPFEVPHLKNGVSLGYRSVSAGAVSSTRVTQAGRRTC